MSGRLPFGHDMAEIGRRHDTGGIALKILAFIAIALLAAACGGSSAASNAATSTTTVAVSLIDNGIKLDVPSGKAGTVTFSLKNAGSVVHSMVVIKTNLDDAKIPASSAGDGRVDERGSVGSTGQIPVGASKDLTLNLAAGKYVLVCNEPAHYIIGMHIGFIVQ